MSLNKSINYKFLSREWMKIIAMVLMFLDHAFMTVVNDNSFMWMTWAGRIAFPVFAYGIVEGFIHTSNRKKYIITMAIFAVISEIPYDLMLTGSPFDPFGQNVMFTFLVSMLLLLWMEKVLNNKNHVVVKILLVALILAIGFIAGTMLFVDYLGAGVVTVLLLYLCKKINNQPLQLSAIALSLIYINFVVLGGQVIILSNGFEFPTQGFAVLSVILFAFYNGRKSLTGNKAKIFKYFSYLFYPVHIMILAAISMKLI